MHHRHAFVFCDLQQWLKSTGDVFAANVLLYSFHLFSFIVFVNLRFVGTTNCALLLSKRDVKVADVNWLMLLVLFSIMDKNQASNPIEILNNYPYRIILGSASPRRKKLLEGLGVEFSIQSINADESSWPSHLKAHEVPLFLSHIKSKAFNRPLEADELLITSDTIVWCEGKVLNKPIDFEDGKKMLQQLSGKMHEVFTAVCLRSAHKEKLFYDRTAVILNPHTKKKSSIV